MTAQAQKRDLMTHLALLYAIWGDEVRSEALRTMIRTRLPEEPRQGMSQQNREIVQRSVQSQAIIV